MYVSSHRISGRFVLCALALAALPVGAETVVSAPNGFDRFMSLTTGANTQTISFGTNGTPLVTAKTATGAPLGNMGVFPDSTAGSKGLEVRGSATLPIANTGRSVPITAVGKITPQNLGKAFTGLVSLAGGWPGLAIFAGVAVIDWYTRAGIVPGANGATSYPAGCTATACAVWVNQTFPAYSSPTHLGLCQTLLASGQLPAGYDSTYLNVNNRCTYGYQNQFVSNFGFETLIDSAAQPLQPITDAQALDKLAATQPLPAVVAEIYSKGLPVNILEPFVLGPNEITGPVETKVTPAQNGQPAITQTTATDYNCVFVMANVTCNEKETVTKSSTAMVNGVPTTTTETTTTTKEPEKKPEIVDPCDANPDRIACQKFGIPEAQNLQKSTVDIALNPVSFAGASGCPASASMAFSIMGRSFSPSLSYQPLCDFSTTYARPLVLLLGAAAAAFIFVGGLKA